MTAKRVDTNQKEVVKALRKMGVSVLVMSSLGKGAPDLALGYKGNNYFVELKDGSRAPSAQKLTEAEEKFFVEWNGHTCILRSVDEAIQFIKNLDEEEMYDYGGLNLANKICQW